MVQNQAVHSHLPPPRWLAATWGGWQGQLGMSPLLSTLHNFEPSAWLGRPSACIHHRLRAGCFCLLGCLSLPSLPISFSAREDSTSWESSEHFRSAGQGLGFSSEHQHSSVPASNDTASPISGLDFGTDTGSGLVGCHRPLWPAGQAHPTQAVRVASFQDSQKAGT